MIWHIDTPMLTLAYSQSHRKGNDAGEAFTKAAQLFMKTSDTLYDASKAYESAAKCYKKNQPESK